MTSLLIVESPSKISTILKHLRSLGHRDFELAASVGHIRDLDPKTLAIRVEDGTFSPTYVVYPDKKKVVASIAQKAKTASVIYLATDLDREGEAISWHLYEILRPLVPKRCVFHRITFHEITQRAIQAAIESPRELNADFIAAQQARRAVDRLIGFKATQMLWAAAANDLSVSGFVSAGRVQSVVLNTLVKLEDSIVSGRGSDGSGSGSSATETWTIQGIFAIDGVRVLRTLMRDDKPVVLDKYKDVQTLFHNLHTKKATPFRVSDTTASSSESYPPKPFITSTLQREAYHKHHFSLQKTMRMAQDLYEAGLITYMRTDSFHLSPEAMAQCREWLTSQLGGEYYVGHSYSQSKEVKGAQEAHEAIRPTHISTIVIDDGGGSKKKKVLTADHQQLYTLIWKRTVASQMPNALYEHLLISLVTDNITPFVGELQAIRFDGWTRLYENDTDSAADAAALTIEELKTLRIAIKKAGLLPKSFHSISHYPTPPSRMNESGIVKYMETKGIGRPSTYSSTVQKLLQHKHVHMVPVIKGPDVEHHDIVLDYKFKLASKQLKETVKTAPLYTERNKVVPTELGTALIRFLEDKEQAFLDESYTAKMEKQLDHIADGERSYVDFMTEFWGPFQQGLADARMSPGPPAPPPKPQITYKIRGREYVVRMAMYGPVIQYKEPDAKKPTYIPLKPLLKLKGTDDWTGVLETDVKWVLQFPKNVDGMTIHYGSRGLYAMDGKTKKSMSLSKAEVMKISAELR
jgi:DNA topoisomerase-1